MGRQPNFKVFRKKGQLPGMAQIEPQVRRWHQSLCTPQLGRRLRHIAVQWALPSLVPQLRMTTFCYHSGMEDVGA